MNRDELEGKGIEAKGKVKREVGEMTDNERMREVGVADEAAGETQETLGETRRKVGDKVEDAGERLKR
jgi:uncharacterized protein YjbJ (UPF0337 family)